MYHQRKVSCILPFPFFLISSFKSHVFVPFVMESLFRITVTIIQYNCHTCQLYYTTFITKWRHQKWIFGYWVYVIILFVICFRFNSCEILIDWSCRVLRVRVVFVPIRPFDSINYFSDWFYFYWCIVNLYYTIGPTLRPFLFPVTCF